jgi:hypothetical protein
MEAVGLKTFIETHPESLELIFPTQQDANICANQLKARLQFYDEGSETNAPVMAMFVEYIDLIESRKEGMKYYLYNIYSNA